MYSITLLTICTCTCDQICALQCTCTRDLICTPLMYSTLYMYSPNYQYVHQWTSCMCTMYT